MKIAIMDLSYNKISRYTNLVEVAHFLLTGLQFKSSELLGSSHSTMYGEFGALGIISMSAINGTEKA